MSGNAKRNIVVATMAVLVCAAVELEIFQSGGRPTGGGDRDKNSGGGRAGLRAGGHRVGGGHGL